MVAWGVVLVSKFNYFFQQELVIIILELQLCDWGSKVYKGLGLESNEKFVMFGTMLVLFWYLVGNRISKDDLSS
jgi:hypothetical protein